MVLEGTTGPKFRVQPVPRPDGSTDWKVDRSLYGAATIKDTKSAAVSEGKRLAKREGGQLIIYDSSNTIQRTHDYGDSGGESPFSF